METKLTSPSVFEGLQPHEVAMLLDRLERRAFPVGASVMAEGDCLGEMYIVQSGSADVFMTDADGIEHRINRVGPGGTLGEIGLITGQQHSATVRAATPLQVLVLSEQEFNDTANSYPALYRNLVAILSRRLVRSDRRAVGPKLGHVTLLTDDGAPPLLGYALACSLAWHTRTSVLLLRIDGDRPPSELSELADAAPAPLLPTTFSGFESGRSRADARAHARAYVLLAPPEGAFAPDMLATTLDHLSGQYLHILLQSAQRLSPPLMARSNIRLLGPHGVPNSGANQGFACAMRAWSDQADVRPDGDGVLRVPHLDAADHESMRHGLLPSTSRAGRALGWVARDVAGLKVGLALGAGSVRGYAHVGVLQVFERIRLGVDYIGGTSIGAAVAALYALGYSPGDITAKLEIAASAAFRLTLPTRSLLSSQAIRTKLRAISEDGRIEDLKIPLALTATDINTRQEVVFQRGLLWPAVLAALTIPGVYPPQTMGAHALVDGAVMNPLPTQVVANMGADVVIAVKLTGGSARAPLQIEAQQPSDQSPSVLEVITRALEIMQSNIPVPPADITTVVIAPEFDRVRGGIGLRNFQEGKRFIELGVAAAEASLPRLTATLPWLNA